MADVQAAGTPATSNCLTSGKDYSINPKIQTLLMGLEWDKEVDMDLSAALLDHEYKAVDFAWWKNLESKCKSVKHSGDGRESNDRNETIEINFESLPYYVYHILFVVSVHSEEAKAHQFENASAKLSDYTGRFRKNELCSFALPDLEENTLLLGVLCRRQNSWSFKALGNAAVGSNIEEMVAKEATLQSLQNLLSFSPGERQISVQVVRGKNLAAKDSAFLWFGKTSSDPYYTIQYQGKKITSQHVSKNLNPHWHPETLKLGKVKECEDKKLIVEIFDYDFISLDDFMGCIEMSAGYLYNKGIGCHEIWFPLKQSNKPGYEEEVVSGEIQLKITVEQVASSENGILQRENDA